MHCLMCAELVRTRNEIQRTVEFIDVIQKNVEIQCQGLRHPIVMVMGREIIMPLPNLARKRSLDVDLDLLDISASGRI